MSGNSSNNSVLDDACVNINTSKYTQIADIAWKPGIFLEMGRERYTVINLKYTIIIRFHTQHLLCIASILVLKLHI